MEESFKDDFYIVYDYDFDLISEDIGHGQCIREHLDLKAAKIGSIFFMRLVLMEDDLTKIIAYCNNGGSREWFT